MKEFLSRVKAAMAAGASVMIGSFATGHDWKVAVGAGATAAIPLIIYGAHTLVPSKE